MNVLVGQGKEAIVRATHRFFDEAAFQREVVQEISIDPVSYTHLTLPTIA